MWVIAVVGAAPMTTFPRKGNSASPTSSSFKYGAVNFGGVKECNAAFHRRTQKRRHFLRVFGWAVGKAHSHAAEPESRDFEIAFFQVCAFPLFLILYTKLVTLPGNSPVFIRASRLYDELFAREIEHVREIFADKGRHQCALK